MGRLRDRQHRLVELAAGQRSVTATLDLSYQDLSGDLRRAYRLLGLHLGPDFDPYAAAALLDLALELSDAVFIPAPRLGGGSLAGTGRARHGGRVLGLHLVVLALERVDLATDKLDLIDVAGNCPAG